MSSLPNLTPTQREAAVERAGESIALTSGAGCGKTLVLARRFTELVLGGAGPGEPAAATGGGDDQNPFDGLVALTFTDKAAAEMTARVRKVLLGELAAARDEGPRRRLAGLLAELPAARVSTIHGFCASLLRRHAVEAGVDPGFTVCADELVAAQMRADAVADAVLAAAAGDRADVLALIVRAGAGRVMDDVAELLQRRIAWRPEDYADPARTLRRWRGLQERLRTEALRAVAADPAIKAELDYLIDHHCDHDDDRLLAWRDEHLGIILRMLEQPEAVTADLPGKLAETPGSLGGHAAWGGRDKMVAYRQRLKAFVQEMAGLAAWFEPMGEADADAAGCLAVLTGLADEANGIYAAAKRAAGMLDFDDLIDLTARLLRDNAAVRRELRAGLRQLMLDECQDTDAVQLEMLSGLLAGTEGSKPAPGKFFIVGDLKQSIYRFRGAQAEVFAGLCESFPESQRISLNESFRTHPAGAAFVNHLFSRMMGGRYEPIISAREDTPPHASVELLLAAGEGDDWSAGAGAEAATIAQADLVARRIEEMIGGERLVYDRQVKDWRAVRPGDVAILFARMTKSLEYERALRERGIDYHVVAGTGFFQQQEVFDVLNVLRAIDNPFDDVALFGALRSAAVGLDDNCLLHLAEAAGPPYFRRLTDPAVLAALPERWREQVAFAAGLLGRLHRAKDAIGPAGLIERVLAETGYGGVLLSEFHGRRKLGNVALLLAAARSAAAGGLTLADFVKRYGELSLAEVRYEQAAEAGPDEDAVRVMTIHKAKGLEFPVVFIPDMNARRRGPTGRLLGRRDWGITCAPPGPLEAGDEEEEAAPAGCVSHRLARDAEKADLDHEDIRKLYVAATRHEDHLVLVGADVRSGSGELGGAGSYLAQIDRVLGIAEAVDGGRETIPYGDGFAARVARVVPRPAGPRRRVAAPIGQRVVTAAAGAGEVAAGLARAGRPADLPLVGPLPARGAGAGAIAPTALADFEHCPMLYRWRHELRVPSRAGARRDAAADARLDAATCGTIFHRCMERADFETLARGDAAAIAAHAAALVAEALAEMELDAPAGALAADLAGMLHRLAETELLGRIVAAHDRLTELTFVHRAGPFDLSGQIDLLIREEGGRWAIVDYKSDSLQAAQVPAHAVRYELQMLLYAAAVARHTGGPPADATLYFLRPGLTHRFAIDQAVLDGLDRRLADLAERLVTSRRTGTFARRDDDSCPGCPYAGYCRTRR